MTLPLAAIQGRYHVARVRGGSGSDALRPQSDAPTSARNAGGPRGWSAHCQTATLNVACAGSPATNRVGSQPGGRLPARLLHAARNSAPPGCRGQALRPLGRQPHEREANRRPRHLPGDSGALCRPTLFALPLPLGNPRSSILGDPATRRLPEMPPSRPETASEPCREVRSGLGACSLACEIGRPVVPWRTRNALLVGLLRFRGRYWFWGLMVSDVVCLPCAGEGGRRDRTLVRMAGLPASERGWASEARQPAGRPAREPAPRGHGSVAGRDAGTKPIAQVRERGEEDPTRHCHIGVGRVPSLATAAASAGGAVPPAFPSEASPDRKTELMFLLGLVDNPGRKRRDILEGLEKPPASSPKRPRTIQRNRTASVWADSRHSSPVFPLWRHGPRGSSPTSGNADRAVL